MEYTRTAGACQPRQPKKSKYFHGRGEGARKTAPEKRHAIGDHGTLAATKKHSTLIFMLHTATPCSHTDSQKYGRAYK
jgi:hypothetical protein